MTSFKYHVFIASNVRQYRMIAYKLAAQTHILEIGCGSGKTTLVLARLANKVLAIDKSSRELEKARFRLRNFNNVKFVNIDAFNVRKVLKYVRSFLNNRVDVMFLDIGGSEDPSKVLSLAWKYLHAVSPKMLVIKNRHLCDFVKFSIALT